MTTGECRAWRLGAASAFCGLLLAFGLVIGSAAGASTFKDPVAYCAAVGTVDRPDARYVGESVPDWIARALMRATDAPPDAPLDFFKQAAWRCRDGKVVACSYGANIPCDSKADVSRGPNTGMREFCAENRDAEVVPASATGRETVYEWRCERGKPVIERQVFDVDKTGYPADFWYEVTPNP